MLCLASATYFQKEVAPYSSLHPRPSKQLRVPLAVLEAPWLRRDARCWYWTPRRIAARGAAAVQAPEVAARLGGFLVDAEDGSASKVSSKRHAIDIDHR